MDKYKNLHTTFSFSPLVVEEMQDMTDGYVVKQRQRLERFGADSAEAKNAESILNRYKKMAQDPRFQFLVTPYASPDLEKLVAYNLSLIHISEPTRLGMISYAVFCLKKKKNTKKISYKYK